MFSRKYLIPLQQGKIDIEFHLSVDCVIFSIQEGELHLLLTRFENNRKWMLPGGFMNRIEDADQAAARILKFRTGMDNVYLNQYKIFSDPNRFSFQKETRKFPLTDDELVLLEQLPDRVISIGYFALVDINSIHVTGGEFGEESFWCPLKNLPDLEYDHSTIAREAEKALRKEVQFSPILFKLLPEKFTMPELKNLYEIVLKKTLDRTAFRRKVLRWDIFEELEERRTGVAHKQPFLYRFDEKKYQLALEQGTSFGI